MGCTCKSPSAPAPVIVNPETSATGQATFNKEAALQQRALNMVDQYTPQGSTTYSPTGTETEGIPGMKVTQALSPEQQGLYDVSTRLAQQYGDIGETQLGAVRSTLEQPFSLEGFGAAPTINEDVRQSTMQSILARQQPGMDRARAQKMTELANMGFVEGTEGYDQAMGEITRREVDLGLAADIQAGNEMARMFGLESSARDRLINEGLMQRNQPLSELSAFMSGSQPTGPSFLPTPQGQIAAPDLMGAQYASAGAQNVAGMNTYNQQMAARNANMQGLYGLGGAAAGNTGYTSGGGFSWG